MVAFGRPKGRRGSYLQWLEGNIPPQVVFEILSPSNTLAEMSKKLEFYDRYGVEEYYLYNPDRADLTGWLRSDGRLSVIEQIAGWVSPRLGVRFDLSGAELQIFSPSGDRFLTFVELGQQRQQAETQLEQERQHRQVLEAKLREMGIDPNQL
jgi:hypothetical protein